MMSGVLEFTNVWQALQGEALDLAVRFGSFRSWMLKRGEKQLYEMYVEGNAEDLPLKVNELRCQALVNLLNAVNKALSDGRIAPRVRRHVMRNFIGKFVIGGMERVVPFREKYGFDPPILLTVSPTKRCNLLCKGCYAASSAKNANTLEYSVFSQILKAKQEEWGSHFTVISGGEPMMYHSEGKDIFDVLKDHPEQYFLMYTNGTLIDREAARKLSELGNLTPAISVEGWEEQTDARRGKGVFRKIERAMENLREFGVPFGISLTATRENAEILLSEEFVDYYFSEKGAIYGWIFQYMPIGRSYTVDLMITPEQRRWMLEKELEMIWDKRRFLVDFWNGGPLSVGCISAGRSGGYFYIDWNGSVAPCVFFPYHLENIHDVFAQGRPLSSVLDNDYFRAIRSWQADYRNGGGHLKNLFKPCPIRDHYAAAREIIDTHHAQPIDGEAASALADPQYKRRMIEYGDQVGQLLDPLWEQKIYPA
jgi:MoaA/NifB/PqqE/SkfB family radical SAM enzyme